MALFIENLTIEALQILIESSVKKAIEKIEIQEVNPQEELLTRAEVCKILKISSPTLTTYTKDGSIPYHKIGLRIRYKKSEILNLKNPSLPQKFLKR